MYTAVVLVEEDQEWLRQFCRRFQLPNWEQKCHHLTFYMGDVKPEHIPHLDKAFLLTVDAIGKSDKAIALRVPHIHQCDRVPFVRITLEKAIPHVTLLVNSEEGGKAKDSNDITEWEEIDTSLENGIVLRGHLKVVKQ